MKDLPTEHQKYMEIIAPYLKIWRYNRKCAIDFPKVRHFFKEVISNSFHRCDGHTPSVSVRGTTLVSNQRTKGYTEEFRINVIPG